MKSPTYLNKRAEECIEDFQQAQTLLNIQPRQQLNGEVWKPPPSEVYKINFMLQYFQT